MIYSFPSAYLLLTKGINKFNNFVIVDGHYSRLHDLEITEKIGYPTNRNTNNGPHYELVYIQKNTF